MLISFDFAPKILGFVITSIVFVVRMLPSNTMDLTRKPWIFEISSQIQLQIDLQQKLRGRQR